MVETREQEKQAKQAEAKLSELELKMDTRADAQQHQIEALDGRFSKLELKIDTLINYYMAQGSARPLQPTQDSSASPTIGAVDPSSSLLPEPPDLGVEQTPLGKMSPDRDRPPATNLSSRLTKIGFPMFNGTMKRDWVSRCEQVFDIDNTPAENKVKLAALHLEGKALRWHHSYMADRYGILPSWTDYVIAISERFSELYDDPLSELVALKQGDDSVEDFLDKFEELATRITLSKAHALSIFLTNLNPHLAYHVRQFEVKNVLAAARIAKLHESSLLHTPNKQTRAPFSPQQRSSSGNSTPSGSILQTPPQKPSFIPKSLADKTPQKYTYKEMQERRNKVLCMFCDEKYTPGHHLKHKRSQIFYIAGEEDDVLSEDEESVDLQDSEEEVETVEKAPVISINALSGNATFNCMRVVRQYGKKKLHILIDNGSTHNFLDIRVANELGCKLEKTKPMTVVAAIGDNVITGYRCSNFEWKVQGYHLTTEVRTLPLDCCDLVLGVQWLSTLGPILWDFLNPRMEFTLNRVKHVLRGVTKANCKAIKGGGLNNLMFQQPQIALLQVQEVDESEDHTPLEPEALLSHISTSGADRTDDPTLQSLLSTFADVFEEPNGLPPFREGFDHRIPLEVGANPVNLRPYRYSTLQKDVIDDMVKEMLTSGIIQRSSSPYASPIVLVKKKDGTWRLCVDYRGLNKQTIKDKYPIPLLEDLLDELGGAKYFSKLDLRAGFHQLRMTPEDIYKTAFKTHSGHYEYLVMPFGLTNAPCTFQGLMNHIFWEVARTSVLVFFDDILVYSNSWEEHLSHLEEVFTILRAQQLYLKSSKCTFGATIIEYLGHFISAEGVSTDPKKIQAITDWPTPLTQKQLRRLFGPGQLL